MLSLALFLALVALAVTMIELMPGMASSEPAKVRTDNQFVLQFGSVPAEIAPLPDTGGTDLPFDDRGGSEPQAEASTGVWYVVQQGDTLSSIALERLGSAAAAADLARLNRLSDPDDLLAGDRIRLR